MQAGERQERQVELLMRFLPADDLALEPGQRDETERRRAAGVCGRGVCGGRCGALSGCEFAVRGGDSDELQRTGGVDHHARGKRPDFGVAAARVGPCLLSNRRLDQVDQRVEVGVGGGAVLARWPLRIAGVEALVGAENDVRLGAALLLRVTKRLVELGLGR